MATFAALRYRNFRLWWISLLVSNSGTWLQMVARDYLVYDLTGRALDLGLVNVSRAVALISLSFLGGTVADRLDQRKLLALTQTVFAVNAAILGLLVYLGAVQVWHVVAASFVDALVLALDQPARQSLLPHLIPREHLMNAVALNSVTFTGAAAFGPALAGPLVGWLGISAGFFLNAATFFAVVWAVWAMRLPPATKRTHHEPVGTAVVSGLRYVAASPAILLLVAMLAVYSLVAFPYQSLFPVFAVKVFGGGIHELGYLRASAGIGALVGGLILARFAAYPHKQHLLFGGALGLSGILLAFSATRWLPVALILLLPAGLLFTAFQSTTQTLLQHLTSDEMRGRVMSLFAIAVMGMWPLGALPVTWAADRIGAPATVAVGGVLSALFTAAVLILAPRTVAKLRLPA